MSLLYHFKNKKPRSEINLRIGTMEFSIGIIKGEEPRLAYHTCPFAILIPFARIG